MFPFFFFFQGSQSLALSFLMSNIHCFNIFFNFSCCFWKGNFHSHWFFEVGTRSLAYWNHTKDTNKKAEIFFPGSWCPAVNLVYILRNVVSVQNNNVDRFFLKMEVYMIFFRNIVIFLINKHGYILFQYIQLYCQTLEYQIVFCCMPLHNLANTLIKNFYCIHFFPLETVV